MSRAIAFFALLLVLVPAHAHRLSDAFLTIDVAGATVTGRWEIALRDLEAGIGVDDNRDGAITWRELEDARPRIEAALPAALSLESGGRACTLGVSDLLVNDRIEGRFASVTLAGECREAPEVLRVGYRFMAAIDPTHRGILVLHGLGVAHTAVLDPAQAPLEVRLIEPSTWRAFTDYLREGVHHIWIGADHILFLLSLLLPCVLVTAGRVRRGAAQLRPVLGEVAIVITAFTLAHSITLGLAAFDVVRLPSRLTESAIAASVALAALNNVWPVVTRRRWTVAFGFGLVHGFGFASVLGELGLPRASRLLGLVAFNLGVEVGQLAIVALTVPVIFGLRDTALYRRGVVPAGSLLIAAVAVRWFAERSGLWS